MKEICILRWHMRNELLKDFSRDARSELLHGNKILRYFDGTPEYDTSLIGKIRVLPIQVKLVLYN